MKPFIGPALIVVVAVLVRFAASRVGVGIYLHDTYLGISLRTFGFWLLMGIASGWFLLAASKSARQRS
jgi:hypothetical protein